MGPRAREAARGLTALALAAGCASRQAEPVRQVAWTHADPRPDAAAAPAVAPAAAAPAPTPPPAAPPRPMQPVLPTLTLDNLRFRDVAECARGTCRVEASPVAPAAPVAEDGATTVPPALAWVHVIRPGAAVDLPQRPNVDLLGVVLVGEVLLERPVNPRLTPARAGPWTAFLKPGCGAVLRASGASPSAVLLVTASGDVPAPATPPAPGVGAAAAYGYQVRDLSAVDDLAWAGGAMHARLAFEAPASPRASLGLLFASDDAPVAEHAHPGSWETLVAFSAAGRLHLPSQSVPDAGLSIAERDRTVTGGTIAYVPASVRHAWRPDGTHPLIAVQVYSPPGPEQRFRALASAPTSVAGPTSTAPAAPTTTATGAPPR